VRLERRPAADLFEPHHERRDTATVRSVHARRFFRPTP
jgi:hypothetical protein